MNLARDAVRRITLTGGSVLLAMLLSACSPSADTIQRGIAATQAAAARAATLPATEVLSAAATNPARTMAPSTEAVTTATNQDQPAVMESNRMNIQIGDRLLAATLVENSSADALKEALADGPVTIDMRDYGSMEKVGSLGMDLPTNDEQITTEAGDIILYQGNALVIYYAPNSWSFTRLGKINNVSAEELREILGEGNVTITLSLAEE